MARVHAFTDDALGDRDAVGLVSAALGAGHVSIAEVVEAAITRTEQVAPGLNALAVDCFSIRARAEAAEPRGGWFAGRTDVRQGQRRPGGDADHAGHGRVCAATGQA